MHDQIYGRFLYTTIKVELKFALEQAIRPKGE
jgi:hypothetical protein